MANDLNTKVNELTNKALEDLKGKVNKETINKKLTEVKKDAALKAEDVQEEAK